MNVPLNELTAVQELTTRIDILQSHRVVQFSHQGLGHLRIAGHHSTDATVQIGNDHAVALARQAGAQILNLGIESPPFVQEYDTRIGAFFLRPELDALDLDSLDRSRSDIEIGRAHV